MVFSMEKHVQDGDEPLPATLTFVSVIGALFFVGWFAMYALLWSRW